MPDKREQGYSSEFKSLLKSTIAPVDIYWDKGNKKTLLCRAGDPLNIKLIDKLMSKEQKIYTKERVPLDGLNEAMNLFAKLKSISIGGISRRGEIEKIRNDLKKWIKPLFWDGEKECSLLVMVLCCHKSFYSFDRKDSEELINYNPSIYKRSSIFGTVWSVYGLLCGYMDFNLLKDLYNITFLLDYGLVKSGIDHRLMKALEMERGEDNSGLGYLKDKNHSKNYERLFKHPSTHIDEIREKYGHYINNISLVKLIKRHHENVGGTGFPLGANEDEISDLEALLMFVGKVISFNEYEYSSNDGRGILNRLLVEAKNHSSTVISLKLEGMINRVLSNISNDSRHYLAISGL